MARVGMLKRGANLIQTCRCASSCELRSRSSATCWKSCFCWGARGRGDEDGMESSVGPPRLSVPCSESRCAADPFASAWRGTLSTISQWTCWEIPPDPVHPGLCPVNTTGGGGWEGTPAGAAGPFNHNRFRSFGDGGESARGEAEYLQILPPSSSYIRGSREENVFAETAHSVHVCCTG